MYPIIKLDPQTERTCFHEVYDDRNSTGYVNHIDPSATKNQTFSWTNGQWGYGNPAWRDQVKHFKDASTEYVRHTLRFSNTSSPWKYVVDCEVPAVPTGRRWYYTTTRTADGVVGIADFLPSNIQQQLDSVAVPSGSTAGSHAAVRFRNSVAEHIRKFSAPLFLVDVHRTLRMIYTALFGLIGSIKQYFLRLSQLSLKEASGFTLRTASELWLQYVFGWKQLFRDIGDALDAYITIIQNDVRFRAQGTARWEGNPDTQNGTAAIGGISAYTHTTTTSYHSVRMVGVGTVSLSGSTDQAKLLSQISKRAGLALEEVFPVLWDALPYSFLIDYFTGLGSFLTACTYQSVKLDWSVTSEKFGTRVTRNVTPPKSFVSWAGDWKYTYTFGGSQQLQYDVRGFRRIPGQYYAPGLTIRYPSLWQIGIIAALVVQRFMPVGNIPWRRPSV